jgi:hypothetical protein
VKLARKNDSLSGLFQASIQVAALLGLAFFSLVTPRIGKAQGDTSGAQARRHTVTGTVINSVTGTPIARALVELDTQNSRHAMTDANGAFRFEGVPEGSATLDAERPGFFETSEGTRARFQVVTDVEEIILKLVPQAEIEGHVRSIQGTPIGGFPVRFYRRTIADGRVQWDQMGTLSSGERDGRFRMNGVTAGSVIISAGPEPWRTRPPKAKHLGYPSVFYPNGTDLSEATLISVSPGQQIEANFSISREPLFEVSGEITGVPKTVDTKIVLSSDSGEPLPLVQLHPEEHGFSAYVMGGKYTLRASAEVEGQTWQMTEPLNINSDISGIQVALVQRPEILVKVLTDSDTGQDRIVHGVVVTLRSRISSFNPSKFVAGQGRYGGKAALEIAGVEPGSYSVEINSYGSYVRSATSGSTDLLRNDLLVPEGGRVEPIEIVLSDDGGSLRGTVKMPNRGSPCTVLLVPEHESANEIKAIETDETGHFGFEQVRPGDYALLAFDRVSDFEYRNPNVLGNYLSSGTRVSVLSGQQVSANLELILLGK